MMPVVKIRNKVTGTEATVNASLKLPAEWELVEDKPVRKTRGRKTASK